MNLINKKSCVVIVVLIFKTAFAYNNPINTRFFHDYSNLAKLNSLENLVFSGTMRAAKNIIAVFTQESGDYYVVKEGEKIGSFIIINISLESILMINNKQQLISKTLISK